MNLKPLTLGALATALAAALALSACSDDGAVTGGDTGNTAGTTTTSPPDATSTTTTDPDTTETPDVPVEEEQFLVSSVDPGKGLTNGLETVEIAGQGFFQGMQVFFGESLLVDVFVLNDHRIAAFTPPHGPGLVDVTIVDPDINNPRRAVLEDGFLYYNQVTITQVDPPTGHVLGGEPIAIHGAGFRPHSTVLFGHNVALSVNVIDDNTINCISPYSGHIGPVDITISNELGVGGAENAFTYVDVPKIDAVVPPVGVAVGGTALEIRGQGFSEPLTVLVGNQPLTGLVHVSDSKLRGFAPAHAAGAVDVVVSTQNGTRVRQDGYTYVDDLTAGDTLQLLAVSPGIGSAAGGEQVVVIAKGLGTVGEMKLFFGDKQATVRAVDATQLTLLADTPASPVGTVDVRLERGAASSTIASAYTFQPFSKITSITPSHGPVGGGTPITVKGQGFAAGLELRVGALAAGQVRVVDSNTIEAVTPPGAAGANTVVVVQAGIASTLPNAFVYDAPYGLYLADPTQGSQAGGTFVTLVGSGFPSDAKVLFGDRQATHVHVDSTTIITCKTPPGDLGTVTVTVRSPTMGDVVLKDVYTYYDPSTVFGGTWGDDVKGAVNVTVMSTDGTGIADAFVILYTDPQTPYQGFTNGDGQITFSGPDLSCEQMVSASKAGFASQSVVQYNATNVTLLLSPTTPPSSGNPPPAPEAPFLTGVVKNIGKSIPVPFGKCSGKPNAPGNLCNACTTDVDCGTGYHCTELPQQVGNEPGKFCTQSCATASQCPSDFTCLPITGPDQQCVPKSGDVTAFCDVTNANIFADDYLPDPGVQVDAQGEFSFVPPFGEFAVFCYAGVIDPILGFEPLGLGVERHVFANPGDQLHVEIEIDHPLNKSYSFKLDTVPIGTEGPAFGFMFPYIDLNGDGVIPLPFAQNTIGQPFVLDHFLPGFSGDIYDGTFTFWAGGFSNTVTSLPQTMTLHQNIPRLEDDTMFYFDDDAWEARRTGVVQNINALWFDGQETVGVGSDGLVIRSIGSTWGRQESGVTQSLRALDGLDTGLVVAVGDGGAITHFNGTTWVPDTSPTTSDLRGVWLGSATDGWAVGFYTVLHYVSGAWVPFTGANVSRNLYGVYGFASNDVWAVGASGTILHFDGIAWNVVPSGTSIGLRAVWGAAADDVWFVGEGGLILHWDGTAITKSAISTTQTFLSIWGSDADNIVAVGTRGLGYRWNGTSWTKVNFGVAAKDVDLLAIGGPADGPITTGEHELVLGPILACPERIVPADNGIMGAEYKISWKTVPGPDPHFSYVEIDVPTAFGLMPEWTVINDFDVSEDVLPDFPSIEGTPGIAAGTKQLTIYRIYKEGFDIDHYSNSDLSTWGWRSWSINVVVFSKL